MYTFITNTGTYQQINDMYILKERTREGHTQS